MPWPDDARAAALRLARKLAALPELDMRRVVLAEELTAVEPARVVAALHEMMLHARLDPTPPYSVAVVALARALGDPRALPYDTRAALYAAAKHADLGDVARLFFAAGAGPEPEPKQPDPEQAVEPRGRVLTLGERKALARGGRRELLQRLLRDPDDAVIRVLLDNPRLTEPDVVFVAARRPVRGDVLRRVFESRWLSRYHVKRALVMNPYTPGDIAVRLLPALDGPDLRAVAADANLAVPVREQAKLLLGEAPPSGVVH